MAHREVQFAGFGGQGIVLAGYITGKAVSLYDGKSASMTQSYGPEARGGACASGVVISDDASKPVDYPKVREPDILVVMSQEAYHKYIDALKSGGILIYDADLVTPEPPRTDIQSYAIPATRIAEEKLGKRIVANVVMLGALVSLTGIVSEDSMRKAIQTTVKKDFVELNDQAFDLGLEAAKQAEVATHAQNQS